MALLGFSRLTRLTRLTTQASLWAAVSKTSSASLCSVCSAIIRNAQLQRLQRQHFVQQPLHGHSPEKARHGPRLQLLLLPPPTARFLQQGFPTLPGTPSPLPPPPSPRDLGFGNSHWGYEGPHGVEHWAALYPTCGGKSQSPVDIDTASAQLNSSLTAFTFSNFDNVDGVQWILQNNGHSAQVTYTGGDLVVSGGGLGSDYRVAQFHFHWGASDDLGSEHTVDSKQFPMEMHIVTYNTLYGDMSSATAHKDGLAVLGSLVQVGSDDNADFAGLVSALADIKLAGSQTSPSPVALGSLMPADLASFWRYAGSLTTPPCSEVVTWTLFQDTLTLSSAQLDAFRGLQTPENKTLVNNFRPTQALNGRTVYTSV